jgi:hypothetical protein
VSALLALGVALALMVAASPTAVPGGEGGGGRFGGQADGSTVVLRARISAPASVVRVAGVVPQFEYRRMSRGLCLDDTCVGDGNGYFYRAVCDDGAVPLLPLFRVRLDPVTGAAVGQWEAVDVGGCPEDPDPVVALSAEDFRRLPLTPSAPQFQPVDGRGLVTMDLILFTDPSPQTLTTSVLGVPVTVRATPTRFSWDLGDGSAPLLTADPGAPYPHHTVARAYDRPGTYAVVLTTTWAGEYQVDGVGPWLPVTGTATTTSAPFTAVVEEAPARLVAGYGD